MSRTLYTVACLARHGIGPEVMAAASRAVAAASRLHGFGVEERHVPCGAEALMRFGHPFPFSARNSVLEADAVLVASDAEDPLETLEAELDVRASVACVRLASGANLHVFGPLHADGWEWTVERAFARALDSRAHVTLVAADRGLVEAAAERHPGVLVERLEAGEAMRALVFAPERFDVVVCSPELAQSAAEVAGCLDPGRATAWGRLAPSGPGVFGPAHGAAHDIAGQDAADPSSMLLAAALMLGEGLGQRSAAATLSSAVGRARRGTAHRTTRQFADVVLAQLPLALANAEFYEEAV